MPDGACRCLPYVFAVLVLIGLAWFPWLRATRPEVAARVGSIQTLSEAEQERLADLGLLDAITGGGVVPVDARPTDDGSHPADDTASVPARR